MSLTKEDLEKIRGIVRQEFDERLDTENLEPIQHEQASLRKLFTSVMNMQVELLDRLEVLGGQIKLIMLHLNLSPETRQIRNTLEKLH